MLWPRLCMIITPPIRRCRGDPMGCPISWLSRTGRPTGLPLRTRGVFMACGTKCRDKKNLNIKFAINFLSFWHLCYYLLLYRLHQLSRKYLIFRNWAFGKKDLIKSNRLKYLFFNIILAFSKVPPVAIMKPPTWVAPPENWATSGWEKLQLLMGFILKFSRLMALLPPPHRWGYLPNLLKFLPQDYLDRGFR